MHHLVILGGILFKNLNFGIDLDSRIAMVGPNGIGKSTILKLIAGELQPSSGTVFRSAKVRIALFSQHHVDGLDLSSNPFLYMMWCYHGVPEQKLRGHLGSFGVTGNLALQPMYTLSGCDFIQQRLYNYQGTGQPNPITSSVSSGAAFDTHYYQSLLRGRGLLFADQQLMAEEKTARLVSAANG